MAVLPSQEKTGYYLPAATGNPGTQRKSGD
jgi:hypothetical protein